MNHDIIIHTCSNPLNMGKRAEANAVKESREYRAATLKRAFDNMKKPYHKCAAAYNKETMSLYPRPCSNSMRKFLRMDKIPKTSPTLSKTGAESKAGRKRDSKALMKAVRAMKSSTRNKLKNMKKSRRSKKSK